jgi:outer membrane protein TolC
MARRHRICFPGKIILILISLFSVQSLFAQQKNLDYFVTSGLQNSPLLKDYKNRLKSAVIDSMRIKAGQGIQVNATGNNLYSPVVRGWGYDEVKTDIAELNAVVQISKEITWNKNLQSKYEAIRLQNQAVLIEGNLSAKDLKKTIISQYILTFGDQQYYELNSEVLDLLRQEELIVKKLTESGSYRQTEYLSFVVNIRQQELVAKKSDLQYKVDFETLNYLCGIFDTASYALAAPDLMPIQSNGMRNTLFYKQFVTDSLKLVNAGRQIDYTYQPKLSVFADGGYLSSLLVAPWKNFGISAGITLTVPIYDGRQRQMQHKQLAISESIRSNYQSFFENQYNQQITLLRHQLISLDQIEAKTIEQKIYVHALVDANRVLLTTGDIPVNEYLLSVNNYQNTHSMLVENKIERFRIINELNYWSEK